MVEVKEEETELSEVEESVLAESDDDQDLSEISIAKLNKEQKKDYFEADAKDREAKYSMKFEKPSPSCTIGALNNIADIMGQLLIEQRMANEQLLFIVEGIRIKKENFDSP